MSRSVILAYLRQAAGDRTGAARLYTPAAEVARRRIEEGSEAWDLSFNLASVAVLRGDAESALDWLEVAVMRGFFDTHLLVRDPVLEPLHPQERFQQLLGKLHRRTVELRQLAGLTMDGAPRSRSSSAGP